MPPSLPLDDPVSRHLRPAHVTLRAATTVDRAIEDLRKLDAEATIFYVYVVDDQERLLGVVPIRQLVTAPGGTRLEAIMRTDPALLSAEATVDEAVEAFLERELLAFPVVDDDGRLLGVVDVRMFTREVVDHVEHHRLDDVFQWIGLHAAEARQGGLLRVARSRVAWLLATVGGGLGAAAIATFHQATLQQALVLAFFLTLVLGLAESVSVQSMTLTLQRLHVGMEVAPGRELATALLIGGTLGTLVGLIAWVWHGDPAAAVVVGGSILVTVAIAAGVGLAVPTLLHRSGRDVRVAAGPLTLAVTDVLTLTLYFGLGARLLIP